MDASTAGMEKLVGSNYYLWKGKMEDMLYVMNYHIPVFEANKPASNSDAAWKKEHRQVCGFVRQWVDDDLVVVRNESDGTSNGVSTVAEVEDLLAVDDGSEGNLVSDGLSWVIDSGASLHVTPRREIFYSYTAGDFGVMRMGNDGYSKVIGIGDIHLDIGEGSCLLLKDVRHVPDVRFNLISVRKLDEEGYCNSFCAGQWKLAKGNLVVARGSKSHNLYVMKASAVKEAVNTGDHWHRRHVPASDKAFQELADGCGWQQGDGHEMVLLTPQLGSVAGSLNKMLMERIVNLDPLISLGGGIPSNKWFGEKVSYFHLRSFDWIAFMQVSMKKHKGSWLDLKTKGCVLCGYGRYVFDYLFWLIAWLAVPST